VRLRAMLTGLLLAACSRSMDVVVAPVTVAVTPKTASLFTGAALGFGCVVGGASDTACSFSVAESGGGTISTSGRYVAPQTAGTYHVVAASHADPTKSDAATVTVAATPPVTAADHFVAHGGTDAPGAGTAASPWATIAYAVRQLKPGDTLHIRGGAVDGDPASLWDEGLIWTSTQGIPWGTDEAHRITIRGYGNEVVRLQGSVSAGTNVVTFECSSPSVPLGGGPTPCPGGRCSPVCPSYVSIENLIVDARNCSNNAITIGHGPQNYDPASAADRDVAGTGPHHIRFRNVEVRNAGFNLNPVPGSSPVDSGMLIAAGDYNEFIDMDWHDNGAETTNHAHAIYLCGKHNLFSGGAIHHNLTNGVQIWSNYNGVDASDNVFENVAFHDNGARSDGRHVSGPGTMATGISVYCGTGNVIRNNTFSGNYQGGVYVQGGTRGTVVTGNLVHDNNVNPETAYAGYGGIGVSNLEQQCGFAMPSVHEDGTSRQHGALGTVVTNNVLWNNTGGNLLPDARGRHQLFNSAADTDCGGSCPGNNRLGP